MTRQIFGNSAYTLFTPGPTKIPDQVLKAVAQSPFHHRGIEFKELFLRASEGLRYIFRTNQPVLILGSSGTGGLEATCVNLFSSGERILVVNNGRFSERWVDMLRTFGMDIVELKLAWGKSPAPFQIQRILETTRGLKGVYLTQCETSTGAYTDIGSIAKIIHDHSEALVCVDGVSSIGALEFLFDEWEIDAAVTASQKALMCPPGLSFVALSERAVSKMKNLNSPRFYFNLNEALSALQSGTTPWTPPVNLVAGLEKAASMIQKEGISRVWERHRKIGLLVREQITNTGFTVFPEYPCDSVTVFSASASLNVNNFLKDLKVKKGIVLGRGQGDYKDKLIRVGHMGHYNEEDIRILTGAIEEVLSG